MGLFNFKKNKEENDCCCGNECNCNENSKKESINTETSGHIVKILGSGCAKCNQLEAATKEALIKLGIDVPIEHVTDFAEIATYGVMSTPALVIDDKVISYGKVLKTEEAVKLLEQNLPSHV